MRTALVYDGLYPYVKGGADKLCHELAKQLAQQYEVHVFSMRFWGRDRVLKSAEGVVFHGTCEPAPMYVDGRRSVSQVLRFSASLFGSLWNQSYDVVNCLSTPYLPSLICKLQMIPHGTPLVVTWLELWDEYWFKYWGWRGVFGVIAEKFTALVADHIVAISSLTKRRLVERGVPEHKVTVVRPGVDFDRIVSIPAHRDRSDVIFVGRLIREKNVDTLLRAISRLAKLNPNITCTIVGDGPEKEALENLSSCLGLAQNVKFLGALDNFVEVCARIKASRVLVLLSEREGFGLVVAEANACGIPAVVARADNSAASELVNEGENGFLCELNDEDVANTLTRMLTDEDLHTRLKENSLDCGRQSSWEAMASAVGQVYTKVAATRSRVCH